MQARLQKIHGYRRTRAVQLGGAYPTPPISTDGRSHDRRARLPICDSRSTVFFVNVLDGEMADADARFEHTGPAADCRS